MKNKIIIGIIAISVLAGGGIFALITGSIGTDNSVSVTSEKIYVAVEGTGEIAVIDIKTNQVVKRIDLSENKNGMIVGYMPHNIQVAPDNKSVWVTANAMNEKMKMSFRVIPIAYADTGHGDNVSVGTDNKDELIVIDPLSDTIVKRIGLGTNLHLSHVSITPDNTYAIAASQEKGILYKVNTVTYEVESEVATNKGDGPHGLRISPDGKTAYVAMIGGKSMGILDVKSFTLKPLTLKGAAVQTGVTPDGKYALASVYDVKSLAIYDIGSSKLSYVDLPQEARGPVQIYPTPDSRFAYVADQGYYFDQPAGDTVYKIDLREMKVAETIQGGTAPHGVVVSRDGKFVYVTNLLSEDVSVIDTVLGKEVAKIKIGKMPNGISLWYGDDVVGAGNYSELVPDTTIFDFGSISMSKGKVSHSFTLKNFGESAINITKIYTSCMCTEATLVQGTSRKGPFGMPGHGGSSAQVDEVVDPGREISIDVVVDPAAHGPQGTGPAKKVVYIETDSAINPVLKLELDINVTP